MPLKEIKKSFPLTYANLCATCLTSPGSCLVLMPRVYQLELPVLQYNSCCWVIPKAKLPVWWVGVSTYASIEINILMGTCRGGISLWDHWNSTFCLLTWHEGSSSVLSSASQPVGSALYSHERPDVFDSVLLSFQDDDTKAKVSVISLPQQLSRVRLVHRESPLWHLFTQWKGSKEGQTCPGSHNRGVADSS